MRYVMSDIHGEYDKYLKMLEKINFEEKDELYIIGDIWDRGPKPLEVLEHILSHKNIYHIKGNHEKMFLDCIESNKHDLYLWFMNGGRNTYEAITEKGEDFEKELYNYIKNLPNYLVIDNKFILVHAGLLVPHNNATLEEILSINSEDEMLWTRSHIGNEKEHDKYRIICGHTPTLNIYEGCNNIINEKMITYIDCGAPFEKYDGRLSCLNLDTMEEFYVH